jgi:glycosyltransferase involved in cell wall biosynthesis
MIENTIHIGPAFAGGMGSVIQGYIKLFGLPKENAWNSYKNSFIKSLPCLFAICFKILFKKQKDIICYHLHLASDGSILRKLIVALCLKLSHKKFIVHIHGAKFQEHYSQRLLVKLLVKLSDAVVCITEQMKNFIEKENLRSRIFVIPNFCETIAENPVDLEKHENPVKIVFAGLYGQRKGIYDLLAAFEKANFSVLVQLDLYGDGEVDKVWNIAKKSAKKTCINVNGWTEHCEYLKKLPDYDFLVLPSYSETFGLSLAEAMGFGIPVASTFAGAIPEVVKNNETGLLVDVGNIEQLTLALEKLANNLELRIELGKNAWKDIKERFSPEIVLGKLEDMYSSIIKKEVLGNA